MDWNVVVTVHEEGFEQVEQVLDPMGELARTRYHNVLVLKVEDLEEFLGKLDDLCAVNPDLAERYLSKVVPLMRSFDFRSSEEFEERAKAAVRELAPELADRSFHVRVDRRGMRERIDSQEEERLLGDEIFDVLEERGESAEVTFDDPDAVVAVETVSDRAGVGLLWREDRQDRPYLWRE